MQKHENCRTRRFCVQKLGTFTLIGVTAQIHTLFIFYTEWMAGSGPSPARAIVWQNGPGPIAELWNFHPNFFFDGFALLTECVGWIGHTFSEIFLNGSQHKDTKSAWILVVKLRVGRVDLLSKESQGLVNFVVLQSNIHGGIWLNSVNWFKFYISARSKEGTHGW